MVVVVVVVVVVAGAVDLHQLAHGRLRVEGEGPEEGLRRGGVPASDHQTAASPAVGTAHQCGAVITHQGGSKLRGGRQLLEDGNQGKAIRG